MSCLYDTLSFGDCTKDLTEDQKSQLTKWITSTTNKTIVKNIFSLIVESYKREGYEDYQNPYGVKTKLYQGVKCPIFALSEMPIELRNVLWNFYMHNKE